MSLIKVVVINPFTKSVYGAELDSLNFAAEVSALIGGKAEGLQICNDAQLWMEIGSIPTERQAFFIHPAYHWPVTGIAVLSGLTDEIGGVQFCPAEPELVAEAAKFLTKDEAHEIVGLLRFMKELGEALAPSDVDELIGSATASGEAKAMRLFH